MLYLLITERFLVALIERSSFMSILKNILKDNYVRVDDGLWLTREIKQTNGILRVSKWALYYLIWQLTSKVKSTSTTLGCRCKMCINEEKTRILKFRRWKTNQDRPIYTWKYRNWDNALFKISRNYTINTEGIFYTTHSARVIAAIQARNINWHNLELFGMEILPTKNIWHWNDLTVSNCELTKAWQCDNHIFKNIMFIKICPRLVNASTGVDFFIQTMWERHRLPKKTGEGRSYPKGILSHRCNDYIGVERTQSWTQTYIRHNLPCTGSRTGSVWQEGTMNLMPHLGGSFAMQSAHYTI